MQRFTASFGGHSEKLYITTIIKRFTNLCVGYCLSDRNSKRASSPNLLGSFINFWELVMEEEREGVINQAGERTSKRRRIEAEQTPQEEDEEEEEEEGDTPPDEDCITDIGTGCSNGSCKN